MKSSDFNQLFDFETKNKAFFEKYVPSRGEDYFNYETFVERNNLLLESQKQGKDYFFVIRNEENRIIGRVNLMDIDYDYKKKTAYIGYRVDEQYTGKGVATKGVERLVEFAIDLGITQLFAQTTDRNLGAQEVMTKTGFVAVDAVPETVTLKGEELRFLTFRRVLS